MTNSQEIFCRNIVQGKSQRESLIIAYPKSKQWKLTTLDSRASSLMKDENVKTKIKELQEIEDKQVQWNRKIATKELLYVLEINKKEQERIIKAHKEEIILKEIELEELRKEYNKFQKDETKEEIIKLLSEIIQLKKQPTINIINVKAILEAINSLNKMYGINKSKNEIHNIEEEQKC